MAEFTLIKHISGAWFPATPDDKALSDKAKAGTFFAGKSTTPRNLQFHRKFFALLNFSFEYWEPTGGLISASERKIIQSFVRFLSRWAPAAPLQSAADQFLEWLGSQRAERYPAPEKSFGAFREWVIREAGFYAVIEFPDGTVLKRAKSIKFSKMEQAEFDELYRAAFAVLWRYVLSRTFDNEAQAEHAINNLQSYA